MMQRAFKKEPIGKGAGVSYLCRKRNRRVGSCDEQLVAHNGTKRRPGGPSSLRIEELRDAWFDASDEATGSRSDCP